MTAILVLIGLALLATGVLALAKPDLMWALTRWRNQAGGLTGERTGTWEGSNKWTGVLSVVFGIALLGAGISTGLAANAHETQVALLDGIRIDCTHAGLVLSNVGEDALEVKLGRLRAVADDFDSFDSDYGPRDVLLSPQPSGFLPLPIDEKHRDATLPSGKALHVPIAIPSTAKCKNDTPALFGGPGCHVLEFELAIARPGKSGKTLWRRCRLQW